MYVRLILCATLCAVAVTKVLCTKSWQKHSLSSIFIFLQQTKVENDCATLPFASVELKQRMKLKMAAEVILQHVKKRPFGATAGLFNMIVLEEQKLVRSQSKAFHLKFNTFGRSTENCENVVSWIRNGRKRSANFRPRLMRVENIVDLNNQKRTQIQEDKTLKNN